MRKMKDEELYEKWMTFEVLPKIERTVAILTDNLDSRVAELSIPPVLVSSITPFYYFKKDEEAGLLHGDAEFKPADTMVSDRTVLYNRLKGKLNTQERTTAFFEWACNRGIRGATSLQILNQLSVADMKEAIKILEKV